MWAMIKCDHYLRGMRKFRVMTDHKPLQGVFSKPLAALNNDRLQRIREKLIIYNFELVWKAGKTHNIADALSRAPFFLPDADTEVAVFGVFADNPALRVIRESIDGEYATVREHIKQKVDCPDSLRLYKAVWDKMRLEDDILVAGERLIVPGPARSAIVDRLH